MQMLHKSRLLKIREIHKTLYVYELYFFTNRSLKFWDTEEVRFCFPIITIQGHKVTVTETRTREPKCYGQNITESRFQVNTSGKFSSPQNEILICNPPVE
jgi:hypothetical protein